MTSHHLGLAAAEPDLAVTAAFEPEELVRAAAVAVPTLREYLQPDERAGVHLLPPAELVARARALMRPPGDGFKDGPQATASGGSDAGLDEARFAEILELYLATGIQLNSPGYLARQFSSVFPASAVFDMVMAMAPQPASFYEAGQLANAVDKIMAAEFGAYLGWHPGNFDMVTTSGGTLANLTALLAARNLYCQRAGRRVSGQPALAIAVSEDAHYSVERAAGVMGLDPHAVVRLPVDGCRRIHVPAVAPTIEAARASGLAVFALVAAAGSTPVGAIDPLPELARYTREQGIWLHVDAAHGGALLVSDELRWRVAGLEQVDSFCLDAHKTLFVPAATTLLFYRDPHAARRAFNSDASYVFDDPGDEMTDFESGAKNLECTKRPAILNLWLVWALYGPQVLAAKLEYLMGLAVSAHEYLAEQPDFAVVTRPETNILCFEYLPRRARSAAARGALQVAIRDRIRAEGRFLISKVDLGDRPVLRCVFMNHRVRLADFTALCQRVREVGDELDG